MGCSRILLCLTLLAPALLGGCGGDARTSGQGEVRLPILSETKRPVLSDRNPGSPYTGETAGDLRGPAAGTVPPVAEATAVTNRSESPAATPRQTPPAPVPPSKPLPILTPETSDAATPAATPASQGQTATQRGEKLPVVNAIVARINDEIITREDILRDMRGSMAHWKETLSPREFEARVRIEGRTRLKAEISMRLLLSEARKKYSDDSQKEALAKEVQKQWQRMLAQSGGSVAALRNELAANGHTEASWRKQQEEMMLVQSFLSEYMEPRITVTHEEMVACYESMKAERFVVKPMEHLLLIKLRREDHADQKAMLNLAASLAARARGGEDFSKLAREFSRGAKAAEGGDWGLMHRGSHRVEAINRAQETLAVGAVSDPIVDGTDVYIIKLADRQVGRTIPFTEVQQECRAAVMRTKRDEMINEYVKTLYSKNFVEVHEENL